MRKTVIASIDAEKELDKIQSFLSITMIKVTYKNL